ncbi:RsmB/NOP family class I SAM-dependent RNA methyltransferase [Shewanella corallii]|uniref:RsmB/NOP family class I SAM-dependent RNA methyltransferase n=1 Tax=Shewanella corallii TaxID=560080 RepID=A0ABT0N400_9GAMM|nr:RsmB/NOP family class I SAM-dependent RNA methyltransferase [Shewanella corallii]MCL2912905.1 RsmB/NOP family class I SAM-dependent RNA methyltransferase [Shewanella corallii]
MAHSPITLPAFDAQAITVSSSQEVRALSYARTLHQLMSDIQQGKLPADKMLANYFREHKKHGSKDRRLLRETLFALFRWWGWLNKLATTDTQQPWLAMLATAAMLENHKWQDIAMAWAHLAGVDINAEDSGAPLTRIQTCFPALSFDSKALLPDWFWQFTDSSQAQQLADSLSQRPPIWARVQGISRDKLVTELQAEGIPAVANKVFDDALSLGHKSINLNDLAAYRNGKLEIQDLASQVIGQVCAPKPGGKWWDTCAGAGGKSLQLSALSQAKGKAVTLTASDIRPQALEELQKRARRAGLRNIQVAPWRSDALPVATAEFDGVLVDAPCSCTGTWRRNPDMRWLDDASAITDKPQLQLDILTRSSQAVKVGGVLVYATCSLAQAENGDVVDAFLAANPEFEAIDSVHPFTGETQSQITVWPYEADSDGMFVARMTRKA